MQVTNPRGHVRQLNREVFHQRDGIDSVRQIDIDDDTRDVNLQSNSADIYGS